MSATQTKPYAVTYHSSLNRRWERRRFADETVARAFYDRKHALAERTAPRLANGLISLAAACFPVFETL